MISAACLVGKQDSPLHEPGIDAPGAATRFDRRTGDIRITGFAERWRRFRNVDTKASYGPEANQEHAMLWLRSLLAFLALPGIFAGLVPPLLLANDPWRGAGTAASGALLLGVGLVVLLWCVHDFVVIGRGTLAPWDPPRRLVVVGLYRYVRNPMYVGVVLIVAGVALRYGSPVVGVYAGLLAVAFHLRVVLYEEPALARQFGEDFLAYTGRAGRWIPRRPTAR